MRYLTCLLERDWWLDMLNAWSLYVDLGPDRRRLSRMVRDELTHIPRGR